MTEMVGLNIYLVWVLYPTSSEFWGWSRISTPARPYSFIRRLSSEANPRSHVWPTSTQHIGIAQGGIQTWWVKLLLPFIKRQVQSSDEKINPHLGSGPEAW